jgi:hypothetical protein
MLEESFDIGNIKGCSSQKDGGTDQANLFLRKEP